jgi:hypothetical protein
MRRASRHARAPLVVDRGQTTTIGDKVRNRISAACKRWALSIARISAWTGTLVLHILVIAQLLLSTTVVPQVRDREALTIDVELSVSPEPPPPRRPESTPAPAASAVAAAPKVAARAVATPNPPPANASPASPQSSSTLPDPVSLSTRIDQQRTIVAAEIARENAPKRRPFRGRSIDAMLPGADSGKLPGFRPRTHDDNADALRRFTQMLQRGLPSAATDFDAPTDLLTEGWEAAHHGSDLAACERQYEQFESDLRRQLCGEVRPPE